MTSKIEEVARDIMHAEASFGSETVTFSEIMESAFGDGAEHAAEIILPVLARAAIKAMREPTEAMQKAIPAQEYTIEHYHGTGHHRTFPTLGSGPLSVWHSMVDAALQEEGE